MDITRQQAPTTRMRKAQSVAVRLPQCIDCAGCTGLCRDLLELLSTPEAILGRPN
jgi:hypothetical protein